MLFGLLITQEELSFCVGLLITQEEKKIGPFPNSAGHKLQWDLSHVGEDQSSHHVSESEIL